MPACGASSVSGPASSTTFRRMCCRSIRRCGEQIRDYLDVREAGRLIAHAAVSDDEGPINVCSGVSTTVRELAERVADKYGRRDLLKFGARPHDPLDPPCVLGRPGR